MQSSATLTPDVAHLVRVFVHPSAWSWRSVARPHFNLWIALEGGGQLEINGQRHAVRAGTAFLLRPEDVVTGVARPRQRLVNFAAHLAGGDSWTSAVERLIPRGQPAQVQGGAWLGPLCRHLSELHFFAGERRRSELLQGIGFLLLTLPQMRPPLVTDPMDRRILRAVERIRQDPGAAYPLAALAADARLSVSQFARRFRALVGESPNRFIIGERIARAESYLRESELRIEAIAERLGYSDVYFFSRQFRRFRGVPPSALRRAG